jgi:hypothetical protein
MSSTNSANVTGAADQLRALLAIPDQRPGAWEAEAVETLHDELTAVLDLLDE